MNTRCLRAFLHVLDEGTVAAAARKMNLSQPAVSRLIQLLEQQVGAQLFFRDQRNLVPTPEAEQFYAEAQRVVTSIDEFPDFFVQLRDRALIPLRVISQLRAANGLVAPSLSLFARSMPEASATLDIHPRQELGRRIANTNFDVGVFVLPLMTGKLDFVRRFRVRLHVLLARDHPLAGAPRLRPADLETETYIALKSGLLTRQAVDRELAKSDVVLRPRYEVSAPASAHRLVADGIGFTFSDLVALEPELRERTVLIPWEPQASLEVGVHAPGLASKPVVTARFLDCLDQVLRDFEKLAPL